ncbi:lytic transglycosylase domain-containing protein [Leptospira koniambonensis]|uniref:Lytic transglycosylase domain-containing protein n=1 Tax=Leptospira koniambonensis TaxID=2484950 RepID=A0A4R9J5Z9_9LEPT|nr:lytic transglycosylase domain-containing protein [Leptospira koniambonensis]TGL31587.1 lytic transglycosylase domain-containing protein [Leptospira koniambonensis]
MKLDDLDSYRRIVSRMEEIQGITERFQPKPPAPEGDPTPKKIESEFSQELDSKMKGIFSQENDPTPKDLSSIIERESNKNHLDPNLVKSVIKAESNFKPNAVSSKGAIGLMQLMPGTADILGVENPFDPEENIAGGTKFLADMMKKFGNSDMAIAAYNAGPGAVQKYDGIPPYKETKDYVKKVNRFWKGEY